MLRLICFIVIALVFFISVVATAQEKSQEPADDTNPTKPVFLSIREEYYDLADEKFTNVLIYRSDKVILNKSDSLKPKGIILRFDMPFVTSDTGETKSGLGDLYWQGLLFPRLGKTFVLAAGSGFVFPTATSSQLGRGKWQAAPAIVPAWFFPQAKGFFFLKFQDFLSFAGSEDRRDVHYLVAGPTLMWRFTRKSWVVLDAEAKTDWNNQNHTSFKSGIQLGTMLNSRLGFWVKPEFPFGANREGDWTLKFTLLLAK